jgi:hypothetical protein
MKAKEINGNIKTFRRLPRTWEDESGLHLNFNKVEDPKEFGFYDVITPQYDKITERLSAMFFDEIAEVFTYNVIAVDLNATQDILDEEGLVIGTKPIHDIVELKNGIIASVKQEANKLLKETDWYVIRSAEGRKVIPKEIKDKRDAIVARSNELETEINALTTVKEVLRYDFEYFPTLVAI